MTKPAVTMSAGKASAFSRFLDVPALAGLARMRFVTRRQIDGTFAGRHRSRQQGGAAEFVDYRQYSAGEDLRRLDWRVLARTGRPYVRLYRDETSLLCTIAIDASASMLFGGAGNAGFGSGGSKLAYAQYLSTALSELIWRQQDQVGLAVVAGALRTAIPPGGTEGHVRHVQRAIEAIETEPRTRLADPLRELFVRSPQRGVLMLISDFLDDDLERLFATLQLFRHRRWELVLLHLIHPDEQRLPEGAAFRFEGMEDDGAADCSPADVRALYQERFDAHCATVRRLALASGCDYRRVTTDVPYLRTLGTFLLERSG